MVKNFDFWTNCHQSTSNTCLRYFQTFCLFVILNL